MDSQSQARSRVHQPCSGCKMLRRKCDSNCLLAPYFPSEELEKFAGVHRVYGASNVIKMIQMVEESNREDAVKSLVYEATARIRDPVYGSAGAVFQLQKMVQQLNEQLESIRVQAMELHEQRDQLVGIIMNVNQFDPVSSPSNGGNFLVENDDSVAYDPLHFPVDCDWILQNVCFDRKIPCTYNCNVNA